MELRNGGGTRARRVVTPAATLGLAAAALALAAIALSAPVAAAGPPAEPAPDRVPALGDVLLDAVRDARFGDVVDHGRRPARRIARTPRVDLAVIVMTPEGRVAEAANVVLSPASPRGRIVPLDGDLRPRVAVAPAYPASLFKLLVAHHVMRLVDRGRVRLSDRARNTGASELCEPAGTRTIARWMDAMITLSDNAATCALIRRLHAMGEMDPLNAHLRALGLDSLRVEGTRPYGGNWREGGIAMTAIDTAKLLLIHDGAAGTLWRTPDGAPVTAASELRASSRAYLRRLLEQSAHGTTLSTTNWCGRRQFGRLYPAPGIPGRVHERWIHPRTGSVAGWGFDARPCNAAAEVTFAHKVGLTSEAISDAGLVRSLPGRPFRRYAVAVISDLGSRYRDPGVRARELVECFAPEVCRSERFARLGAEVDRAVTARSRLVASRPR